MFFDIHTHILHNIDDGAKDLNTAISLLESAFSQGVTDLLLTPHFYPLIDSLEEHKETAISHFEELKKAANGKAVPNIYLGNEVLYFNGISKASSLEQLTLNNSPYILLEGDVTRLTKSYQEEILHLKERGFTPIIAHIERYHKTRGFRSFLKFIKQNGILTQVNATSFFSKNYSKILKKLVRKDLITFLASDTHSLKYRPIMIKEALQKIEATYGTQTAQKLITNSQQLFAKIVNKDATV